MGAAGPSEAGVGAGSVAGSPRILTFCPGRVIFLGILASATSSADALGAASGSFIARLPAALSLNWAGSSTRPVDLPKSTEPVCASFAAVILSKVDWVCGVP